MTSWPRHSPQVRREIYAKSRREWREEVKKLSHERNKPRIKICWQEVFFPVGKAYGLKAAEVLTGL